MKMLIFIFTSILIATLPCTSNPLNILHKNKLDFKDKFQIHQTLAKRSTVSKESEKLNIRLKRDFSNLVKNSRNNLRKPLENIAGISERMFDSNGPSKSKTSAGDDINRFIEKSIFPTADDNFITERMQVPLDGSKAFTLNSASPSASLQSKDNNLNLNMGNSKTNGGTEGGVLQTADNAGNANNMASLVNSGNGVSANLNNEKLNKDKSALSSISGDSNSINKAQGLSINANEKKGKSEGLSVANSTKGKVGISNDNLSNSISTADNNTFKGGSGKTVAINNGKGPVSMSGDGASLGLSSGTGAGLGMSSLGINVNNGDQNVSVNSESENLSNLDKNKNNTKIDLNNNIKNSNTNLVGSSVIRNADKEKDIAEISSDTDQVNNANKGKGINKDVGQEKGKQVLSDGNDDTKGKANGTLSDEPSTSVSVSSNGGSGVASVSSGSAGAALPLLGPVSTKPLNNLIENIGNNIKNNIGNNIKNNLFGSAGNGNTAISIANENGGTAAVKNDSSGVILNVNNQKNKPEEVGKSPALGNGALAVSSSTGSPVEKETEIEKQNKETAIPEKGVGNGALAVSSGNTELPNAENEEKLPNTPNIANFPANNDKPKTYTSQDGNIVVKIGKNNFVTSITFKDPSASDHGTDETPKQVSNLPVTSSSISVNDGNKDSSNDKSKNIPPVKAVSSTGINNENNNDNNNTPNTMVTSVNSNNRKENPSDVVTSASVNSGPNNPGGVAVSATSGSGLNAAKALSTGLSLANGNIGLNMGDGGISVSLKDGIRPENNLNIKSQMNKDDANEVTTKSKMFSNEDSNSVPQTKKNSIVNASKNQIKDEQQNSNDIETSNNMAGAVNVNDLSNDKNNRVHDKGNNGNGGTISNDNGKSIITNDSAKTSKKGPVVASSFNNNANVQGITFNGNSNLFQVADYNNGSKAFASPDGKTKLFVGNNAIISTSDIPGGGSSSFSYTQGENKKEVVSNLGGKENPSSNLSPIASPPLINFTVPENNNFNNQHENKHSSRFYNSLDNKIIVEIGNDSFIKSASFQELEGPPSSHTNVKPVCKNAAIQPNEKLFKSRNGKMTVVIENDDHIKFLNFFETSNANNNHNNMDQNNENKEVNSHNNKINGEDDNTKTDKEKSQVNVNNDRNAVVLSGSGEGGPALNNDKSHKNNNIDNSHTGNNIDGSGVNSNNVGSSSGEAGIAMGPLNGNSVISEANSGGNGPKKSTSIANASTGSSPPDGGSGVSVSSVGAGLTPPNGGSGIAFSSGGGGLSVSSGGGKLSASNGGAGISLTGGGAGLAAANDNGNSKNGNAISINSGVGSGVMLNSALGNGVSSVASSVGDGAKSSGFVSNGVTGASANDAGSGISVSNIGENMNLKIGDNGKQFNGKSGGPKVELTDRGLNLQL